MLSNISQPYSSSFPKEKKGFDKYSKMKYMGEREKIRALVMLTDSIIFVVLL